MHEGLNIITIRKFLRFDGLCLNFGCSTWNQNEALNSFIETCSIFTKSSVQPSLNANVCCTLFMNRLRNVSFKLPSKINWNQFPFVWSGDKSHQIRFHDHQSFKLNYHGASQSLWINPARFRLWRHYIRFSASIIPIEWAHFIWSFVAWLKYLFCSIVCC